MAPTQPASPPGQQKSPRTQDLSARRREPRPGRAWPATLSPPPPVLLPSGKTAPILPAQASSHRTYHVAAGDVPVLAHNCTISARSVRFTQDSAGKNFKDGRLVMDLAGGLSDGSVDPSSLPPIRIFNDEQRGGMTYVQNGDGITIRGIGWFNFLGR